MSELTPAGTLPIPLYHGTSSLFLNSIIKFGLGGRSLLAEWNVLEFSKIIYPLVEKHLANQDDWMVKAQSFKFMVEQKCAAMNFQHGHCYLSPSVETAVRYAANSRYGSELLTYTLDFLSELARIRAEGVCDSLYRAYPQFFNMLDISPAPLLVQVDEIPRTALIAEDGTDAQPVCEFIGTIIRDSPDLFDLLQQSNFRLREPVPVNRLKISFINVTRADPVSPEYSLYSLSTRDETLRSTKSVSFH